MLVPTDTADAVTFTKDDEPNTTKFSVTNSEPLNTCVPLNVFEPGVA